MNFLHNMIANIPFSLTECLAPKEVGELLDASKEEHRPVEDLVTLAVRDMLERRRAAKTAQQTQPIAA